MAASSVVTITIRQSAAIGYAQAVAEIADELIDLVPDWQQAEREALAAKLDAAIARLVKRGLTAN